MTIEEFITARLDEDETAATAARPGPWHADEGSFGPVIDDGYLMIGDSSYPSYDSIPVEDTAHIARHDPARVLRQVAATRALMSSLVDAVEDEMPMGRQMHEERKIVEFGPIAAIWSDHPDYRPEWAAS